MEKLKKILKKEENIFFIIKLILEIISFSLVCLLCSLSSKNPFDKIIIDDSGFYFYHKTNINIKKETKNLNSNNSTNSSIIQTQLINEENYSWVNISNDSIVEPLSISFCDDMYNSFENSFFLYQLNYCQYYQYY